MTKVITSKERVKHVHTDLVFLYFSFTREQEQILSFTPNNESDRDRAFTHSDQSWILEPFGEIDANCIYNFYRKQFAKIS